MNPSDKRLAVHVEDHTLEYGTFEGVIPEGQYGAGKVLIWDSGSVKVLSGSVEAGRVEFTLSGNKLKGAFVIFKMSGKLKEWLLVKKKDSFADEGFKMEKVRG